ncbi:hypothetical protein ACHWQZ_G010219 [Mnemiopsis leidyi]
MTMIIAAALCLLLHISTPSPTPEHFPVTTADPTSDVPGVFTSELTVPANKTLPKSTESTAFTGTVSTEQGSSSATVSSSFTGSDTMGTTNYPTVEQPGTDDVEEQNETEEGGNDTEGGNEVVNETEVEGESGAGTKQISSVLISVVLSSILVPILQ